jgi:uncharacterized protein involved in exopolysaccharide biosynthesis
MEEKQYIEPQEEESSVDYGQIFATLKKYKRLYMKVLLITFIGACVYTLGLRNYYTCEVLLSPELSTTNRSTNMALLTQLGMNMRTSMMATEALYPTVYPELMNSTDFKATLFNVPVHKKDSTRILSYYDYLAHEQKPSWWGAIISAPFRALGELIGTKDTIDQHKVDPFMLTKEQSQIVKAINQKVVCDVDQKSMVISITVTDQDPLICATIADTVQQRLQNFITDYRTKKAKVDLEFCQKLFKESKARYDKARQLYASYSDANQDMILQSYKTKLIDLENEMQLQFNNYNAVARQLQAAEAKVQEDTPAFTLLQSATVPVKKSGPARSKMVLVFLFLAFLATTVYILHKEKQLKPLLGM